MSNHRAQIVSFWLLAAVLALTSGCSPSNSNDNDTSHATRDALPAEIGATPLLELESGMKFLANESNPGLDLDWTDEDFNDESWNWGEYGVGFDQSDNAKNLLKTIVPEGTLSVYTRTYFTVSDVSQIHSLFLDLGYDDGCIAWINGVEVFRSPEMPTGHIAWDTPSLTHEPSNDLQPDSTSSIEISTIAIPSLVDGENLLAVGVWNSDDDKDDLLLTLMLSANERPGVETTPENGDPHLDLPEKELTIVPNSIERWGDLQPGTPTVPVILWPVEELEPPTSSNTLVRGPYLQSGTPTSVVVRWRTESSSTSRVHYGTAPSRLTSTAMVPTETTEHGVELTGLLPDTSYFYEIGDSEGRIDTGSDEAHLFVTAPEVGTHKATRVWVLGDSGTADDNARSVRDAYYSFTDDVRTDCWLMLGDNAYNLGTDDEYQKAVFDMYTNTLRTSVLWPTLGNHDMITADSATESGPYYDIFDLPAHGEAGGVPSGTEAYYSFDHSNIHFVCLDSSDSDQSASGPMLTWLKEDLASTDQDWIIAFWHHPPYSKCSHDSDWEFRSIQSRENALPILEDRGVDLVLTGHSHSYERSFLIDGHYEKSDTLTADMVLDNGDGRPDGDGAYVKSRNHPSHGTVYVVSGASGKATGGRFGHPVMFFSVNKLGSVVLDINGLRLDLTFIDEKGLRLDYFSIVKS